MYGLIRPFREDTPYYRNVEQILKSNGMKHLKINKNLYICIVNLMSWKRKYMKKDKGME